MTTFYTLIIAQCPQTGITKTYSGDRIPANTAQEARTWADNNGKGYLHVIGRHVEDIPAETTFNKMQN